jgi:Lar family restriction alleviation protein
MDSKLLPCPFCVDGGQPAVVGPRGNTYVECYQCGATSAIYDTKAEAVAAWNRRVPTQPDSVVMAEAERRGMLRAAEICNTGPRTDWTMHVRANIARQIKAEANKEQADGNNE